MCSERKGKMASNKKKQAQDEMSSVYPLKCTRSTPTIHVTTTYTNTVGDSSASSISVERSGDVLGETVKIAEGGCIDVIKQHITKLEAKQTQLARML